MRRMVGETSGSPHCALSGPTGHIEPDATRQGGYPLEWIRPPRRTSAPMRACRRLSTDPRGAGLSVEQPATLAQNK
eukprot:4775968-Pyramimonas_sp.AAC.1